MRPPIFMSSLVLVPALVTATVTGRPVERPYLDAALGAARWLESVAVPTPHGLTWPAEPGPDAPASRDLYHGSAGVILFLMELHRATGDPKWLELARRGADDLLAAVPETLDATLEAGPAGLWVGVAGYGYTLAECAKLGGEARHREGARRCVELLLGAAVRPPGGGLEWNDSTDVISGGAGIGLFLLYAHRELDEPRALPAATGAAVRLLDLARPHARAEGSMKWPMTPGFERLMPNFSHGTAGVAYFLVRVHLARARAGLEPDGRFLDGARAGARYLLDVADTAGDGCRVFHHEPGGEDLYYLGWCHGPVGTARLFVALAEAEPDAGWADWARRGAGSIMGSGIPEERPAGFWNNAGQCCGSAGVASFFLDLHRAGGGEEHLRFATRVADDLLSRATAVPLAGGSGGLEWVQAEHRVRPELLAAQTGFMQGAAGIGLCLLQLDAHRNGRRYGTRIPDSPF